MNLRDVQKDHLPPVVRRLIDLVGAEAVEALLRESGRIYVPHLPREGQRLVELVGLGAALVLAEEFGGEKLDLPSCVSAELATRNADRNAAIRARVAAGASRAAIARELRLSTRQLRRILAEWGGHVSALRE